MFKLKVFIMKRLHTSAIFLSLIAFVLLVMGVNQAYARDKAPAKSTGQNGRLIIKRSPVLGDDVSIVITIDGKLAGSLVRSRTYDGQIAPGRHVIGASPNKNASDWQGSLDVAPGQTYTFVASYNVNRLVLTRVKGSP